MIWLFRIHTAGSGDLHRPREPPGTRSPCPRCPRSGARAHRSRLSRRRPCSSGWAGAWGTALGSLEHIENTIVLFLTMLMMLIAYNTYHKQESAPQGKWPEELQRWCYSSSWLLPGECPAYLGGLSLLKIPWTRLLTILLTQGAKINPLLIQLLTPSRVSYIHILHICNSQMVGRHLESMSRSSLSQLFKMWLLGPS